MSRIDHRVLRSVLGALALYFIWHAVAPPFDVVGTPVQARMLMAFLASVLIAGLTLSLYRPTPSMAAPVMNGTRMRAHRPRPWRSRMASAHIVAIDARPLRSPGTNPTTQPAQPASTSSAPVTSARRALQDHVIVLCDGTSAGDAACRLAQRLADRRQAVIRALAILPENVRDARPALGEPGAIEHFLEDVNEQMRRTTPTPAAWRLTLIVHDVEGELRRACAEFGADTILVPSSLRTPDGDVLRAASAAVDHTARAFGRSAPIICVVAEEKPFAPEQMHQASLRADTAAPAAASARPESVTQP